MARVSISILAACLMAGTLYPADAATRTVQVPTQYDGAWRIVAVTVQGPCSASTSYQVQITGSSASIPARDVDIAGGVSDGGAVQATITQGSNKVPIVGRLDATGKGSGTWRTSGGLVGCSGNWSAKRTE